MIIKQTQHGRDAFASVTVGSDDVTITRNRDCYRYVPTPRCRHLRTTATIRGGSFSIDMFFHSVGPLMTTLVPLGALTMGNSEFLGNRPAYSKAGSWQTQEVFSTHSRINENPGIG